MSRKIKPEDCLSSKEPQLVKEEWHEAYNLLLGYRPENISAKSTTMVYWKCLLCGQPYRMSPRQRIEKRDRNMNACFRCGNKIQKHSFTVPL